MGKISDERFNQYVLGKEIKINKKEKEKYINLFNQMKIVSHICLINNGIKEGWYHCYESGGIKGWFEWYHTKSKPKAKKENHVLSVEDMNVDYKKWI